MYISELSRKFDQIVFCCNPIFLCKKDEKYYEYDNELNDFREVTKNAKLFRRFDIYDETGLQDMYCYSIYKENYPAFCGNIAVFIVVCGSDKSYFASFDFTTGKINKLSAPVYPDTRLLCVYEDSIFVFQTNSIVRYSCPELSGELPEETTNNPEIIEKDIKFMHYPAVFNNIAVFRFFRDVGRRNHQYIRLYYVLPKKTILERRIIDDFSGQYSGETQPVHIHSSTVRDFADMLINNRINLNNCDKTAKIAIGRYYWFHQRAGENIQFVCYNTNNNKKYSVTYNFARVEKSVIIDNKFINHVVDWDGRRFLLILSARDSISSAFPGKSRINPEIMQKNNHHQHYFTESPECIAGCPEYSERNRNNVA